MKGGDAKAKKYLIEADLVAKFDADRLEYIDKFALQTYLNKLARVQSRDRVLQIRAYLQAIFHSDTGKPVTDSGRARRSAKRVLGSSIPDAFRRAIAVHDE